MSDAAANEIKTISSDNEAKQFLKDIIEAKDNAGLQSLVTKNRTTNDINDIRSATDVSSDGTTYEIFGYGLLLAAIKLESDPTFEVTAKEQYKRAISNFKYRISCLKLIGDELEIEQLNNYISFAKRRQYLLECKENASGWGAFLGFIYGLILGAWRGLIWGTPITIGLSIVAILAYKAVVGDWFTDVSSLLPSILPFNFSNVFSLTQHALFNPLTWGLFIAGALLVYSVIRFAYYGAFYGADGAFAQATHEAWSESTLLPNRAWKSSEDEYFANEIESFSNKNPPQSSASTSTIRIIGDDESSASSPLGLSASQTASIASSAANSSSQIHPTTHVSKKKAKKDKSSSSSHTVSSPASSATSGITPSPQRPPVTAKFDDANIEYTRPVRGSARLAFTHNDENDGL